MKKLKFILIFILMTGLVSGCGVGSERKAAEKVAEDYFAAIESKDFDKALTFYASIFFENTPIDWLQALKVINAKLGGLETYELFDWKIEKCAGTERPTGTYYVLGYKVTYTKYMAEEELTFYRPSAGGEIKICGQNIRSPGLLEK